MAPVPKHTGEPEVITSTCVSRRGSRRRRQRGAAGIRRYRSLCAAAAKDVLLLAATCLLSGHLEGATAGRVKSADRRMKPGHEQIVQMEKASLAKPTAVPGVVLAGKHAQYRSVFVPVQRFTPVKLAVRCSQALASGTRSLSQTLAHTGHLHALHRVPDCGVG